MQNRLTPLAGWLVMALSLIAVPRLAAQNPSGSTPDFSGVWMANENVRSFNFQEPPPLAPRAAEIYRANRNGIASPLEAGVDIMDPSIYCLSDGFPRVYLSNYPVEIVQVPGRLYMHFESGHLLRRVYLDGRIMPDGYPPSFMGFSSGRWDRDTLVIETTGLTELTWIDRTGTPHSDALRVVERMRRPAQNTIEIDLTFHDSKAFTKPWTGKRVLLLQPDWEIIEQNGVCEDRFREDFSRKSLRGDWANPEQY